VTWSHLPTQDSSLSFIGYFLIFFDKSVFSSHDPNFLWHMDLAESQQVSFQQSKSKFKLFFS